MKSTKLLYFLGRPLSPLYSLVMQIRAWLYSIGLFSRFSVRVPVISVGNLTMGGTGKSPTVEYVARYLLSKGYRPAIISRGYGGTASKNVNIVSDGRTILLNAEQAGDEPYMLAHSLPDVAVLTGKKRIHPCNYAVDTLKCDILILDDGFQHLSVSRDVDLVLFNATSLAGNNRVFPGGELREPFAALQRASAFLLTGVTEANEQQTRRFTEFLQRRFTSIPIFFLRNHVSAICDKNHLHVSLKELPAPLFAFSGIAHPERFQQTLKELELHISGSKIYDDHAKYTQAEIDTLIEIAHSCSATGLITTYKDIVKLQNLELPLPIYFVKIEPHSTQPFPHFLAAAIATSKKCKCKSQSIS